MNDSNGSNNGNMKQSLFKLAPPDLDESKVVPELRVSVRKIPDMEPSYKVVFDCLCEDNFRGKFRIEAGIIRRAKVAVAHACGLSPDTVRRAANDFRLRRLVFTSVHWDGLGEMTYWFIVGLASKASLDQAYDEATGRMLRLARRPSLPRGERGQFVSLKPQKQAENDKNSGGYGVSQPSARCKSAIGAGQVSRPSGVSQPSNGEVTPSRRLIQSVATAVLSGNGRGQPPQTRNVVTTDSNLIQGGAEPPAPPDIAFEDWKKGVAGPPGHPTHRSKLLTMEKQIAGLLATSRSDARKAGLKRQLDFVRGLLLPVLPDDPKPVHSPAPPKTGAAKGEQMSPEKYDQLAAVTMKQMREAIRA